MIGEIMGNFYFLCAFLSFSITTIDAFHLYYKKIKQKTYFSGFFFLIIAPKEIIKDNNLDIATILRIKLTYDDIY